MRTIFFFIAFVFIPFLANAQCDSTQWAKDGSYELVKVKSNSEANTISRTPLTSDQLCLIESSRSDYYFAYIDLDANTRIKIYPRYPNNSTIEK